MAELVVHSSKCWSLADEKAFLAQIGHYALLPRRIMLGNYLEATRKRVHWDSPAVRATTLALIQNALDEEERAESLRNEAGKRA